MMVTNSQIREELVDREAIRDCLYRYARGIDRVDEAMLRSVYWSDATDDHAGMFSGPAGEFIAQMMRDLPAFGDTMHVMANILIRLDGDSAKVESYVYAIHRIQIDGAMRDVIGAGRYLDRFERRVDEWRIAARVVTTDWFREFPDSGDWAIGPLGLGDAARGVKGLKDKSYSWLGLI